MFVCVIDSEIMTKIVVGIAVVSAAVVCVGAAHIVSSRIRSRNNWNRTLAILQEFQEECSTSLFRLRQVVDAMTVEMHAGLASEGGSKLKMLLSYVDNLPSGYVRFHIILFEMALILSFCQALLVLHLWEENLVRVCMYT